jgi:hypothetical protein
MTQERNISCIRSVVALFRIPKLQLKFVRRPAILTEVFRIFPQSSQEFLNTASNLATAASFHFLSHSVLVTSTLYSLDC